MPIREAVAKFQTRLLSRLFSDDVDHSAQGTSPVKWRDRAFDYLNFSDVLHRYLTQVDVPIVRISNGNTVQQNQHSPLLEASEHDIWLIFLSHRHPYSGDKGQRFSDRLSILCCYLFRCYFID